MTNITFATKPSAKAEAAETALQAELAKQGYAPSKIIVFAIGGDGTLLKAIRDYIETADLFVGISAGTLGFLQAIETDSIPQLVTALISKQYSTISAPLLAARDTTGNIGYAFNDISVERFGPRAAKFSLQIGDSPGNFVGDGIIFATPLGSTAYSLATGGPIIDSEIEHAYVVTPNNPHVSSQYSSLQRPHVMHGDRVVSIMASNDTLAERPLQVIFDGFSKPLNSGIEIYLSDKRVKLLELSKSGFHNRIEDKRLGRS
jgi:NAD+ kinase